MRKIERTPEYLAILKEKARQANREWYQRNLENERNRKLNDYYKEWEKNKQRDHERHIRRYADGPPVYNEKQKEQRRLSVKKNRDKVRGEVRAIYGDRCRCCGERNPELLTLDHVNDDGASIRGPRMNENGRRIGKDPVWEYRLVINVPEIRDRYQLLCFNCNCKKGKCKPHTNDWTALDQTALSALFAA